MLNIFSRLKVSQKTRLFCGPAKNLRGPGPVHGPAVEKHWAKKNYIICG